MTEKIQESIKQLKQALHDAGYEVTCGDDELIDHALVVCDRDVTTKASLILDLTIMDHVAPIHILKELEEPGEGEPAENVAARLTDQFLIRMQQACTYRNAAFRRRVLRHVRERLGAYAQQLKWRD